MGGYIGLGCWYHDTSHYSSHRCNENVISYEKVLKCLWAMEYVDIGLLIKATIRLVITEFIMVVMLVDIDIGHN